MSCYNKNLRSTLLIFKKKFWFREFSSIRAEGRLSRFSVAIVLSPSTVTFRSGTFLCFRSFHISEKIGDKNWSAYHDSAWGILSPHSTETFLEENFWVSENFCYRNIIRLRRGWERSYMIFCRNCLSHNPATFRRGTHLWFRNHQVWKDLVDKRGRVVSGFAVEFFCLTVAKPFVE